MPGKLLIFMMASVACGASDEGATGANKHNNSWSWQAQVKYPDPGHSSSADEHSPNAIRAGKRLASEATTPAEEDLHAVAQRIRSHRRKETQATTPAIETQLEVRGIRNKPKTMEEAEEKIKQHDDALEAVLQKTGGDRDMITMSAAATAFDAALETGMTVARASSIAAKAVRDARDARQRMKSIGSFVQKSNGAWSFVENGKTGGAAAGAAASARADAVSSFAEARAAYDQIKSDAVPGRIVPGEDFWLPTAPEGAGADASGHLMATAAPQAEGGLRPA